LDKNNFYIAVWRAKGKNLRIMKTTALQVRNSVNSLHIRFAFLLIVLGCFALLPKARAECRDGCDGLNTFQGEDALPSVTIGFYDTAMGYHALFSNTTGSLNTAMGGNALSSNTTGIDNTALGFNALSNNTTGLSNTAAGSQALVSNTTGGWNTAIGLFSLFNNTTGYQNTATGAGSLLFNTTGRFNTATGYDALVFNETGEFNTATGEGALLDNTTGSFNTANGFAALFNNTTGSNNIALGNNAGINLTTGDDNIDIGNAGVAGEAGVIRIGAIGTQTATFVAGIRGVPISGGTEVGVNSNGQLGVRASSARYKEAIKPMDKASEAVFALKPVTFRYKHEFDSKGTPEFGLVAEDVAKVNPDLVARDDQGQPYTVRYEAVNAMLLNEFLKEHRKVAEQGATITELKAELRATTTRQQKQIDALTASLQKVSAQLEPSKPGPQMVSNP
jgi:trimeric autotransporter adhesin